MLQTLLMWHEVTHWKEKKRERFSAGHRIMGHYFAKICGYSSFNKKTTCHSFSAVNIKPSAPWCSFSFRTQFLNKSIFNCTKRRSRPTDLGNILWTALKREQFAPKTRTLISCLWSWLLDRCVPLLPYLRCCQSPFCPQYSLNLTYAFAAFHACQRQEVISLVRLSSFHYQNHKCKENSWKFTVPKMSSHAHCKAYHACEIRKS